MKSLPVEKVIKILEELGFRRIRQKGSHMIFHHPDCRMTVIPFHRNEDIRRGLLRKIMKDARISKEEFIRMVEE